MAQKKEPRKPFIASEASRIRKLPVVFRSSSCLNHTLVSVMTGGAAIMVPGKFNQLDGR
jgi:hypothetical protein